VSVPRLTGVQFSDPSSGPLLVLGPSLGTSVTALWSQVAAQLADRFHLVGWELPGHGRSTDVDGPFTMGELAGGVLTLVEGVLAERGEAGGTFAYAGDSVGGAVGLQLLLDHPDRVRSAVLLCTGAMIGEPAGWRERAATVRTSGTPVMVPAAAERWFADGFLGRRAEIASGLLHALQDADAEGYALVCEALAGFDVRDRLGEIAAPVLAVAGAEDVATPPDVLDELASGVADGRLVVLENVAHLAPAEAPEVVARLLADHLADHQAVPSVTFGTDGRTMQQVYDDGMAVRRAVLGDAHVDRATAAITEVTQEFQEMITRYAWGTIWTRPGLDRRSRSMITLTALIARGHHEELAMHLRAALTNGLTREEITEVLLQSAIYCGVPEANSAFRIAQQVFADLDGQSG
jgi:3-oxoadipate enol-lactonase/4-carboxymuconolactone decarboxylase